MTTPYIEEKVEEVQARFYKCWENMKTRCLNPKHKSYTRYGGRGIGVCKKWLTFTNFKNDMYESYLEHRAIHGASSTTLDRRNNNLGYSKKNCRWATHQEQNRNTSSNVVYCGELARDASVRLGGKHNLVTIRLGRLGWSKHKAFNTPLHREKQRYQPNRIV